MKRLRVILLFLVLGAIVNVVVAWGCGLLKLLQKGTYELPTQIRKGDQQDWFYHPNAPGATAWSFVDGTYMPHGSSRGFGFEIFRFEFYGIRGTDGGDVEIRTIADDRLPNQLRPFAPRKEATFIEEATVFRCGWPMKSLHGFYYMDQSSDIAEPNMDYPRIEKSFYLTAETVATTISEQLALPCLPVWTGFGINSIFFGVLGWLIVRGPLTIRELFRNKRGHCVKCAYDLSGTDHDTCPECGVNLKA